MPSGKGDDKETFKDYSLTILSRQQTIAGITSSLNGTYRSQFPCSKQRIEPARTITGYTGKRSEQCSQYFPFLALGILSCVVFLRALLEWGIGWFAVVHCVDAAAGNKKNFSYTPTHTQIHAHMDRNIYLRVQTTH